jgi:hypothetical protein
MYTAALHVSLSLGRLLGEGNLFVVVIVGKSVIGLVTVTS